MNKDKTYNKLKYEYITYDIIKLSIIIVWSLYINMIK